MPKLWEYTAHAGNTIRKDVMEAETEKEVRTWLREQGMFPLEIKVAPKKKVDYLEKIKGAFKTPEDGRKRKVEDVKVLKKKVFIYTAVPFSGGDELKGEISAVDDRTARQLLRERSLFPTKMGPKPFYYDFLPTSSKIAEGVEQKAKKHTVEASPVDLLIERFAPKAISMKKIPIKEMVFYTQQMSTMMDAGLSVSQTLDILNGNIKHRRLLQINTDVLNKIYEGISLSEAFGEHRQFLPDVFVELISIGEQSGNMEETTARLAEYLEKTAEMQRKVKSAMSYPIALCILIGLIVLGLMLFVVPTFIKLFDEFKLDLPPTTRFLLAMSKYIQAFWWTIPLYVVGFQFLISWFMRTSVGRALWDRLEYKVPLLGKLSYKVTISRMLYNLALFIRCGVPITTTLEAVREATRNFLVAAKVEEIRLGIVQGARMATLFEASALFPPFVNHLLVAGEESGAMDDLLMKGAKYVDQEIEQAIKALTSAIEPIMTVVIAGIVLFILGSLYMPLIGLMANTGKVAG
ncbi:MAG: type II secretion system F family protein [Candidatus Sericytochromatia bacterium]|nr:type II secretion system F family protein [Candidatus Tanganyikabacteria bacterium]